MTQMPALSSGDRVGLGVSESHCICGPADSLYLLNVDFHRDLCMLAFLLEYRLSTHLFKFMPVTRSASGASARKTSTAVSATVAVELASVMQKTKSTKRKAPAAAISKTPRKKARSKEGSGALSEPGPVVLANASTALPLLVPGEDEQVQLVPAVLSFSFKEAKKHLANADVRFEGVFKRLKCKPFEHLEMVDPFRFVYIFEA